MLIETTLGGAISLAPWLQPGDQDIGMNNRNRLNGFFDGWRKKPLETVEGSFLAILPTGAKAAMLMKSLRVAQDATCDSDFVNKNQKFGIAYTPSFQHGS